MRPSALARSLVEPWPRPRRDAHPARAGLSSPHANGAGPTAQGAARIGPNAVTRLAEALVVTRGRAGAEAVFSRAGLAARLATPPRAMVAEAEVSALHAALRAILPSAEAYAIAADAGRRTAAYLLVHRIPRAMRVVLPRLPPRLSARLLLGAIGRHAWTFAGSGRFEVAGRAPTRFSITGNPMARGIATSQPACAYCAATFEGLFRALVHPATEVREIACEATGDPCCLFEARWTGPAPG
jgi:divinyl protochlorophyllide a 8-vinyl-reductase